MPKGMPGVPLRRPSRDDVYEAWLAVQRLSADLKKAVDRHEALAQARYTDARSADN